MKIRLLTITHKSPAWIQEGYQEYAKRLPASCGLELVEIPAEKRTANADLKRITDREGEKMLAAIKPNHCVIALDVQGKLWTTEQLALKLTDWQQQGRNIDLLVGGPEGLSQECLKS
jgi:23S rRNA (pseudouridine1915-N3)-methyltransferase